MGDSLAALRESEFPKLFIGQATSVVGSMFRVVALPFAVLAIGGTATDIGIVEAAGLIPLVVLVLLGGVWADRLPRRLVMLVADVGRTVLQLTSAALLIAGVAHVWQLAVLQIGMGVCEAFFGPAYTGLVPEVVSPPRLHQANALQGLVSSGSITLGAFLAGMLVAAVGPGWAIGSGWTCPWPGRRGADRRRGRYGRRPRLLPRPRGRLARVHESHLDLGHGGRRRPVPLRHRGSHHGARSDRRARRL